MIARKIVRLLAKHLSETEHQENKYLKRLEFRGLEPSTTHFKMLKEIL